MVIGGGYFGACRAKPITHDDLGLGIGFGLVTGRRGGYGGNTAGCIRVSGSDREILGDW